MHFKCKIQSTGTDPYYDVQFELQLSEYPVQYDEPPMYVECLADYGDGNNSETVVHSWPVVFLYQYSSLVSENYFVTFNCSNPVSNQVC